MLPQPFDLLATKFYRPNLPVKRVSRPQLLELLNEGLAAGRPLTLISAPAGFGKTTCALEWLGSQPLPVSWLSLDSSDDDPSRFFAYFLAALQKIDPQLGKELMPVIRSGQVPRSDVFCTTLINGLLRCPQKFILVLDDFQEIIDNAILSIIECLISNQAPQLHLVLITREDPLLPLARLRANQQMTEIRAIDLRFSGAETGIFMNELMGLALSKQDLSILDARTEGWVVGLQLAALSMRGRKDTTQWIASLNGSHRHILSYLTEEVLSRQPDEIQYFLLQTSILDRLNGELCDALTGRNDSALLLERLLNANLFLVPLDDEQHWYRYHRLFADLLQNRQTVLQKEQVALLHQRASQWFETAGMTAEAIQHALAAADYERAVQLIEQHAMALLMQGYAKSLESWLQSIPGEWQSHTPRANLAFGWMYLLMGSYTKVPPHLKQVEAALEEVKAHRDALEAETLCLKANLLNITGKPRESLQMAEQALNRVAEDDDYVIACSHLAMGGAYRLLGDYPRLVESYQNAIRCSHTAGYLLPEILAVSALTLMAIQHGQLHFAKELGSSTLERFEHSETQKPPILGSVYGVAGIIHYHWNQLERCRELMQSSWDLSHISGHNAGEVYFHVLGSRMKEAQKDLPAAAQEIQEAVDLMARGIPAWLIPEVLTQQVRIYLAQTNLVAAENVLKGCGVPFDSLLEPDSPASFTYPQEMFALAWLRLMDYQVKNRPAAATLEQSLHLAERIIQSAERGQRTGNLIQTLLLRALIQAGQGQLSPALQDVERALCLAEPENYRRLLLDEGSEMASLLWANARQSAVPDFTQSLLDDFVSAGWVPPAENAPARATANQALIEPLTEREIEVLRLIAEGLKYEEIAAALVITVNTVRFYVKEIYSKLNVNNRTRAIETARQLKLL